MPLVGREGQLQQAAAAAEEATDRGAIRGAGQPLHLAHPLSHAEWHHRLQLLLHRQPAEVEENSDQQLSLYIQSFIIYRFLLGFQVSFTGKTDCLVLT